MRKPQKPCPTCHGLGKQHFIVNGKEVVRACTACKGTGKVSG